MNRGPSECPETRLDAVPKFLQVLADGELGLLVSLEGHAAQLRVGEHPDLALALQGLQKQQCCWSTAWSAAPASLCLLLTHKAGCAGTALSSTSGVAFHSQPGPAGAPAVLVRRLTSVRMPGPAQALHVSAQLPYLAATCKLTNRHTTQEPGPQPRRVSALWLQCTRLAACSWVPATPVLMR